MSRYIDLDALLKSINKNVAEAHNERCAQLLEAISNAPTVDVVEVVRCKDCKHCTLTEEGEHAHDDIVCDYFMTDGMLDNDYCSYGERREE